LSRINPQQKKERVKETFLAKLNTKPLKFKKWGQADGGGGGEQAGGHVQGTGTPTQYYINNIQTYYIDT
jgi:hypothetical protein